MTADDYADLARHAEAAIGHSAQAVADFRAAANPATILRLIAENRQLREALVDSETNRHDNTNLRSERLRYMAERDALAARLAAVEALLVCDCGELSCVREQIRAVLSAAPTDTTKEN